MFGFLTNLLFAGDEEPKRIGGQVVHDRSLLIDDVMKEMGYSSGYDGYAENVARMQTNGEYTEFERRLEERCQRYGV